MGRIGLLGGTFDPPHFGHLRLAETAREQLQLDRVLFLPVGQPPHKEGQRITAVTHRLAMLQRALAAKPHFWLDCTDVDRPQPHSTVSLLPLLRAIYPKAQLWLLLGGDSLRDLPTWHQPQQLIQLCRLAVLPRPGATINWPRLKTAVPQIETAVDILQGPTLGISATQIRCLAKNGRSLQYLTETAVCDYITQNQLY